MVRLCSVLISCVLLLGLPSFSKQSGDDERGLAPLTGNEEHMPIPDCTETILLTETRKKHTFETESDVLDVSQAKCEWIIIGNENCRPSVKCSKFKLQPPPADAKEDEDPCPDEFFEITDGSGGYKKFCGDKGPDKVIPPDNLRELYIKFRGHKNAKNLKNKGFKCTVTCSDGANETPLPKNMDPEVNKLCSCGRKPNKNRIVGGEDAARGDFPWIVALVTAGTRRPFCGGTIINSQFIATAAHCFKGPYIRKTNMELLANARILDITSVKNSTAKPTPEELAKEDLADESIRFKIDKYFIHPLYVRQTNDFDIALIKLDRPIDFAKTPQLVPACISQLGVFNISWENEKATVAGWGLNNASSESTMAILQKLDVTVFPLPECRAFFDERINRRMMCAGFKEGGKDSCKGDSGGPLISEKPRQVWQLIGTVSWGEGCAGKALPGVYVRISEVNQWIRYIVNKEDGVWCRDF